MYKNAKKGRISALEIQFLFYIIYYGNIDNTEEATFLKNNQEELGEAIVIALADYLNIPYQPISGSNYYIVKKAIAYIV